MNNLERIPLWNRIVTKVKSRFNPQVVEGRHIRSLIMATLATLTIGEISAYRLLQQDVKSGELNVYTIDFIIIGLSLLEALAGPFASWLGYSRRRLLFLVWNVAVAAIALFWLAMPAFEETEESEYCHANNPVISQVSPSASAAGRLSLLIISSVIFCLARVAVWSHGLAYIMEHAPTGISSHFGFLLAFRIVGLVVFNKITPSGKSLNMQVFAISGSTIGNVLQVFWFMPKNIQSPEEDPQNPWSNRGFVASGARIFRNTLALTQMVAIAILAAALWGYAYYDTEIVKVKYHIDISNGEGQALKYILGYLVVFMSVLYVGVNSSTSTTSGVSLRAVRQATLMSLLALLFYVLLAVVAACQRGHVAGLAPDHYSSPECSRHCGCVPRWQEFSPVCVVDDVTTFLSPCHAGCSYSESLDNIRVYMNCTCAMVSGRAAIGACSQPLCAQALETHQMLFIMVVLTTVLAFQAQGMVLLRSVDPRDRSLALGAAGSVVAVIAFGCGHLLYWGISAASCRWFEAGRCHLYSASFPKYVAFTSAGLVFLAFSISVATWVTSRLEQRRKRDLASPEERILMDG